VSQFRWFSVSGAPILCCRSSPSGEMHARLRSVEDSLSFIEPRVHRAEQWLIWIVELIAFVYRVRGRRRTDCKSGVLKFPILAANQEGNALLQGAQ
jgi:hypothetical protein